MDKVKQFFKDTWIIFRDSAKEWNDDDAFQLSAVIAYYAIFSIPALLVIVITTAGVIFGQEAVQGEISRQISGIVGSDAAKFIESTIEKSSSYGNKWYAIGISIGTLIFGATGVFFQLQKILNRIWGVEPVPKNAFLSMLKSRAMSLGMILVIGFLLLISLMLTSLLSALSNWMSQFMPEWMMDSFFIADLTLSFAVITTLFALIFKILPDVDIQWRTVWIGAAVTTLLFLIGKFALGIYFGQTDPTSTYGAAGSAVLILLWVNYSCLIMLFGAEFTQVYGRHFGHQIMPAKHAVRLKYKRISREKLEEELEKRDKEAAEKETNEPGKTG